MAATKFDPVANREANRAVFLSLEPGDVIELEHEVKVGLTRWQTTTRGTVIRTNRQRNGLHWRRSADDHAYRDEIIIKKDAGDVTTLTVDEWSTLKKLSKASEAPAASNAPTAETAAADEKPTAQPEANATNPAMDEGEK